MNELLINWNTARLLSKKIEGLGFMQGLGIFVPEMHASWVKLTSYTQRHFRNIRSSELSEAIILHMDKVTKLQEFIKDNSEDQEAIQLIANELFSTGGELITGAKAVHLELLEEADALVEWVRPIRTMMGLIKAVTDLNPRLDQDEEEALRQYINWRTS